MNHILFQIIFIKIVLARGLIHQFLKLESENQTKLIQFFNRIELD
jgi:hypothetical protein